MDKHNQPAKGISEFAETSSDTLTQFCRLMVGAGVAIEDLIELIYRRFSRSLRSKYGVSETGEKYTLALFKAAIVELSLLELHRPRRCAVGRDLRVFKELEEDLLSWWRANGCTSKDFEGRMGAIADRLAMLEFDLRAPVILFDHLGLEGGLVMQILGLRWAVFRHRLHRGRTELQRLLQGVRLGATVFKKEGRN